MGGPGSRLKLASVAAMETGLGDPRLMLSGHVFYQQSRLVAREPCHPSRYFSELPG